MWQPSVIDGLQFARGAETLAGTLDLLHLHRLAEMQCAAEGLSYELRGKTDAEGRSWLDISVSGTLTLTCQRCLGPLVFPLALRSELLLATSEREIEAADDDIDRVLASKAMDVCELVEDELILALPLVPRHEQCGETQEGAGDRPAVAKLKRIQ